MRTSSLLVLLAAMPLSAAFAADQAPGARPDCASYEQPLRRRPGDPPRAGHACDEEGVNPGTWGPMPAFELVTDRWQIVTTLGYPDSLWNPYDGNNVLKGDRPVAGEDWFFSLALVSDSTFEARSLPTPVAIASSPDPGEIDVLGSPDQSLFVQNVLMEFVLYKGETVFKPPDYEVRFLPVFNFTRVEVEELGILNVDPARGTTRNDNFVGIQGLFLDKHLRNVSDRYDFDSLRIGIQPVTADFRGFLFLDSPLGVRLFGTRDNNRWQYNLGWFRRIEKDTNSGLNDISAGLRDDDVFLFNVYRQDFPVLGFTSQIALVHNRNSETGAPMIDANGFVNRPAALGIQESREYDVTYAGYNGDGHFGRWNMTVSAYLAFGTENPATFTDLESDIRAAFAALEVSRDFDWLRLRGTFVYGSGDDDPYDDVSAGYDAIFENPLIAGADTSFWIRQAVPLIGGGRVTLSSVNGILNSMRPTKTHGQSNFTNPGLLLAGIGVDLDITPKIRASLNASQLWFDDTAVLEAARNQGGIDRNIGQDLSLAIYYRPLTSQNVILRVAAAALIPGEGYEQLYGSDVPYSVFANLILAY